MTAALVGVQGLTIDATGSFKLNTSSADNGPLVDWTTASGIDNDPLNVMPDLAVTKSQLLSAIASARLTLAVGNDDVASLSADIRVEQRNVLGQKLYLLGAENVEAFLGLESEDLGIQLRYGIVAGVLTSSGFALQGSAQAEATGFDFILSGVVKVEVNQTGTAWNQLVPLPISETEKLVSFVDGQKFTRFELPTDFDIVLSANSVLTELLYDLAREVDSIYESLQTKQDSNGTPLAGSPLVSYLPGTTLSIDDLLPVKKLTLGGKNIAYYLDYMDYLSDPTGKQAPANPESLPTPDLDFNQDGINETAPTLRGLIAYLNKYWVKTFSKNATDELKLSLTPRGIAFRIALSTDENVQTELNIDTALEGFPLSFDAGAKFSLNAKTAIDIGFDLNWVNPAFRFDVNNLALFLKGNTNNLVAVGAFGPLAVNIGSQDGQKGVVSVDLGGAISVVDGRFTFTPASNSFDVLLPVYVTLAGVNLTSGTLPTVHVAGTIFGPNAGFTLEANHFENLLDFSNLTVIEIIQMFPDFRDWLRDEVNNSDSFLAKIPFVEYGLNQVLQLANAFDERVYSRIDFNKPRVDLPFRGDDGQIAANQKIFVSLTSAFDDTVVGKYVSFLDSNGKVTSTFEIRSKIDGNQLELGAESATALSGSFVVHEKIEKIKTMQELADAINRSGILPSGMYVTFDIETQIFSIPFAFSQSMPLINSPIDLGVGFEGFSLSTNAQAAIDVEIRGSATLYVDLDGFVLSGTGGNLTSGSTTFSSATFEFKDFMVNRELKVGGKVYKIKKLLTANSVELDRIASQSLTDTDFLIREGLTFGVFQPRISAGVLVEVMDLEVQGQLAFLGITAGGPGTGSGVEVDVDIDLLLDRNP
ncbi:MAG: hypothetical protein ACKOAU_09755, partial [Pirellula sp.]